MLYKISGIIYNILFGIINGKMVCHKKNNNKKPMGLISLTWGIFHNLVKINSLVIEILSFTCSVLFIVKADGDHLEVPKIQKNQNGLMQKLL